MIVEAQRKSRLDQIAGGDDCRLKKGMIGRVSGWLDEWMVNKGNLESAETADVVGQHHAQPQSF